MTFWYAGLEESWLFTKIINGMHGRQNIKFVMSVCSYAWNNLSPTGRIFM